MLLYFLFNQMEITYLAWKHIIFIPEASIGHISSKSFPKGLTIFYYLTAICTDKKFQKCEIIFKECYINAGHSLFLYCGVLFCFVFIVSLNSVSFWVISTSQRLRKLIEFWDQFISLHLCSLCSSFFWYVHFCL